MLEIDGAWVRKLDVSTFSGDAWALAASVAVPGEDVPRFVCDGSPIQWTVAAMNGDAADAEQVADTATSFSTSLVKISKTERDTVIVRLLSATTGTNANREFTEVDVSAGDVVVLAVTGVTDGEGSAAFLWVYPTAGVHTPADGAVP